VLFGSGWVKENTHKATIFENDSLAPCQEFYRRGHLVNLKSRSSEVTLIELGYLLLVSAVKRFDKFFTGDLSPRLLFIFCSASPAHTHPDQLSNNLCITRLSNSPVSYIMPDSILHNMADEIRDAALRDFPPPITSNALNIPDQLPRGHD
jgi:hypothetical protein